MKRNIIDVIKAMPLVLLFIWLWKLAIDSIDFYTSLAIAFLIIGLVCGQILTFRERDSNHLANMISINLMFMFWSKFNKIENLIVIFFLVLIITFLIRLIPEKFIAKTPSE